MEIISQVQSINPNVEILELTKYLIYLLFAGVITGVFIALRYLFTEIKSNKVTAELDLKEVNDRLIKAESDIKLNGSHDKTVDREVEEIKQALKEIKIELSGLSADIKALLALEKERRK